MKYQPIIVIGMHRSGTTMITNILENLGLFMGARQNTMQEARFFFEINVWLLEHTGGSWITPEVIDTLYVHQEAYDQLANYIQFLLGSPRIARYMGWPNYLRYRTLTNFGVPWGWKDPRTTYTLPLWLRHFPDAKVIHIHRNGVDVAQSVYTRSQKAIKTSFPRWQQPPRRLLHIFGQKHFPRYNTHFLSLEQSFRLWERYSLRADQHIDALPPESTRTVCYEAFLSDPLPILEDLCDFIGLNASTAKLQIAAASIDPSRGHAYKHDPLLVEFYETIKTSPQMLKYGYV